MNAPQYNHFLHFHGRYICISKFTSWFDFYEFAIHTTDVLFLHLWFFATILQFMKWVPKLQCPIRKFKLYICIIWISLNSARIPEYYLVNICNDSCFLESFHFNCTLCENKKNMSYPKTVVKLNWFKYISAIMYLFLIF